MESTTIEYKSSLGEWKEIIISLCAFANTKGGVVTVGLNDNGAPTGIEIGKSSIEDFANKIYHNTDPILYPAISVKTYGPEKIIEISIHESEYKPVFAFGRAYIRVGKSNQKLSAQEIKSLAKKHIFNVFENEYLDYSLNDIKWDVEKLLLLGKRNNILSIKPVEILKKMGWVSKNKVIKFAYLLFAENNELIYSGHIKAARFKGVNTNHFLDMKEFQSNLLRLPQEILSFSERHINLKVKIKNTVTRNEEWDYSLTAIREAIVNAIVHRDYRDEGQILVKIFDDRMEILSPGVLPPQLNIDKLNSDMRSIPRNPNIARVFHAEKLIEAWGTGIQRMIASCLVMNKPAPEFKEANGAFIVTFYSKKSVKIERPKLVKNEMVLSLIKDEPGINAKKIALRVDVSIKTIERILVKLKADNQIEFYGSKKSGGYRSKKL